MTCDVLWWPIVPHLSKFYANTNLHTFVNLNLNVINLFDFRCKYQYKYPLWMRVSSWLTICNLHMLSCYSMFCSDYTLRVSILRPFSFHHIWGWDYCTRNGASSSLPTYAKDTWQNFQLQSDVCVPMCTSKTLFGCNENSHMCDLPRLGASILTLFPTWFPT